MKIIKFNHALEKRVPLVLIALSIILYISRTAIPFFKYPFLLIFSILSIYILFFQRRKIIPAINNIKNYTYLIVVLFFYLIISCWLSDKLYLLVVKDIISILILFMLIIQSKIFIYDNSDLQTFLNYFIYLWIIFAMVISIQKIYYFFYISSYANYLIQKESVSIDYNFALLPVFYGLISILYIYSNEIRNKQVVILSGMLMIFSTTILLSGSKRGIIVFLAIFSFLFLIQFLRLFRANISSQVNRLSKNSSIYLLSFILFAMLLFYTLSSTPLSFKHNIMGIMGVKDKSFLKTQIAMVYFRYYLIFNKSVSYSEVFNKFWEPVFDPKDPESGWGEGIYKVVPKLSGKNVEIVPSGSKGYLLDSSCIYSSSSHHAYYFLRLKKDTLMVGDSIMSSVYCYVSEDFNGNAALRAEGSVIGNRDVFYDRTQPASWQKLIMPLTSAGGDIYVYLYMNIWGSTTFSDLKGYAIFAYPEYKTYAKEENASGTSQSSSYFLNKDRSLGRLLGIFYSQQQLEQNLNCYYEANAFSLFQSLSIQFRKIAYTDNERDPIRNWIKNTISEDTTYHGYNTNINVEYIQDTFGSDRIARWRFAKEIFINEYNLWKKIFGGGFNFLNWYGYHFLNDKTESDHPHNPFLFILLYSGIFGFIIYLIVIIKVFQFYCKNFKRYQPFSLFFFLTFFFTFFSGGNPFDPPLMGFLVILPFLINSMHKNIKV